MHGLYLLWWVQEQQMSPAVVAAVALAFLQGVAEPLRSAEVQRLAADGARARAASLANTCDLALLSLSLPLAGLWRTRR